MTTLSVMMGIDALLHFYLVVTMILKQLDDQLYSNTINVTWTLIKLPVTNNSQLIVQFLITGFFLVLISCFISIIQKTHSLSTLGTQPTVKRTLTLLFVALMTCLQIPFLEVIIGMAFIDYQEQATLSQKSSITTNRVLIYAFASLNGILFLGTAFLLQKLYIIRIPSIQVHWAASNTQLHSMKLINKILLVICHLYVTTVDGGAQQPYLTIPVFLLFAGTGLSRIMLIPHYRLLVEWYTRLTELLTACLMLILLVAQSLASNSTFAQNGTPTDLHLCLLVGFVAFPCTIGLAVVLDLQRSRSLWSKLENNDLKLEIELEHSLYLLIERVKSAMGFDDSSALAFADILFLVDVHNRNCNNHNCPCQRREIVQYLLNKGHNYDLKKLVLDEEEIALLNAAGTNVFIKSNKNSQAVKTLTLFQHFNFYAAAAAAELSDTPFNKAQDNLEGPAESESQQDQSKQRVRVNIAQLKITFLNQFAEIFFEEARKKFPQSKCLFFQYAYFTLQCCRNRYMTETLLRNFEALGSGAGAAQKTGWIEKVSIQINELQTIMEINYLADSSFGKGIMGDEDDQLSQSDSANWGVTYMRNGKTDDDPNSRKNGQFSSLERFDPEHFILISELTEHFYEEVEFLANAVSSFWKLIQNDALEVDTAHGESVALADIIARVYRVFKEIEDASEGNPGSGKTSDFRVCYTFAQLQKLLLNDLAQHDLYIAKMNSQREMQRLIRNNMLQQQAKGPEDTGFALVNGSNRNFGNLILCNSLFRKQLGFSSKELRHSNILDYMPGLVKQWHRQFVADFSKNGGASNGMLNKTNCMFFRKKNGYITPAMMNVRFHYSRDHEFTFVLFASFMQEIQIQRTAGTGRHKVDEVLFFLCDDLDGRVIDISESCSKQLGLSMQVLHNSDLETVQTNLTVEDICPTLSFKKMKQLRNEAEGMFSGGVGAAAIEEIVDVDLNIVHSMGVNFKQGGRGDESKTKMQKALCQVFMETYGAERDKTMNIVSLILLDQLAMKEYLSQQRQERRDKRQAKEDKRNQQSGANKDENGLNDQASTITGEQSAFSASDSQSQHEGSDSHSSRTTGTSETSVLKQLYSSTDKTASSSLKLITQLIFLVFILLLVVSTINLVLSLNRYEQLQNEVKTVRQSYDRIQINGKTRLLLRGLLNIANGYEPNVSEMTQDRFRMFQIELENQIQKLKQVQDYLDRDSFEYSSEFKSLLQQKIINVEYLDPFNQPSIETQTYTYAVNLFIQRASGMSQWPQSRFKGNINIMRIGQPPPNYTPSEDERTLYFLVQTAQGNLRSVGKTISDYYRSETEAHALSVAQQTQLTIILSIASIVIVCIMISPIICRIEQRKFMGLKFFLNVEPDHLVLLERQVKEFLNLAFSDSSVHTGATHQEGNVTTKGDTKHHNKNQFVDNDKYNQDRDNEQNINYAKSETSSSANSRNSKNGGKNANNDMSESDSIESSGYGMQSQVIQRQDIEHGVNLENNDPLEDVQFQRFQSSAKFAQPLVQQVSPSQGLPNKNQPSVIEESDNDAYSSSQMSYGKSGGYNNVEDDEDQKKIDEETEHQNARKLILATKFMRIYQIIYRQKLKTVGVISILGLIFSSYFIAGYFFSVQPFQETPDIIRSLDTVFFRDITIENAMGFIRCNQLLNETIPAVEDPSQTGADFFLKWSEDREKDFLEMRKNLPSVFKEIRSYFDQIETTKLCDIANKNEVMFAEKTALCRQVYHGVLQNGLTYTMAVILSHFRNLNLKFESYEHTLNFLTQSLRENATLSLIEVKHFVMDNVFTDMKNMVTESTTDYYRQLIRQYTVLYSLFVVLMFALFLGYLVFVYNRIKDAMWKTNLTLKIMPLDFIPKHCLPELKAFFKS